MAGVLFLSAAGAGLASDLAIDLAGEGRWTEAHREALRLLVGDPANATGRVVAMVCHVATRPSETRDEAGHLATVAADPGAPPALRGLCQYALGAADAFASRHDPARERLAGCLAAAPAGALGLRAACLLDTLDRRHPPPGTPAYAAAVAELRPRFTRALTAEAGGILDGAAAARRSSPPVIGGIVRFYRRNIRPAIGSRCSLQPSCSEYFLQAGRAHGALAAPMIADRLFREPSVVSAAEEPVMVNGRWRFADPVERHYPASRADQEAHAH